MGLKGSYENYFRAFFKALNIPDADINLGVGSGTHAEQVGRTMMEFEKVLKTEQPDWVVVVGDVNATCACSITAKKEGVKVAHIDRDAGSPKQQCPEPTDIFCLIMKKNRYRRAFGKPASKFVKQYHRRFRFWYKSHLRCP